MMKLLGSLFGGASRGRGYRGRSRSGGMSWGSKGWGAGGRGRRQRGRAGFFNSPLGRMAMGGLATYAARRFLGRRRAVA